MPQFDTSPFVQTTEIFDIQDIRNLDVNSADFKEFLVILTQSINNVALAVNDKNHGIYSLEPYPCGKQYYPSVTDGEYRGIGRTTINFAFTISPGVETIPHNIVFNAETRITLLSCELNDPAADTALPVPFVDVAGAGAGNIALYMDATNVYVETASNRLTYTDNTIVIEYTV